MQSSSAATLHKEETVKDLGFTKFDSSRFQQLADNPEIVEKAKADARAKGEVVNKMSKDIDSESELMAEGLEISPNHDSRKQASEAFNVSDNTLNKVRHIEEKAKFNKEKRYLSPV